LSISSSFEIKKIKELQEHLTQDILNVLDHHTDSGYDPAYKAEITQLVEQAWPYIVPAVKDRAEAALKNFKALNNPENQKAFIAAFNDLMKLMKIAQYAPPNVREIIQNIYSQMETFIIAIKEQEIQIALEILFKKIDSGDTMNKEITQFIRQINGYIKLNRNSAIDIYKLLLKKNIEKMESLKAKIKNGTFIDKWNTHTQWSNLFYPVEIIISEIQNLTHESCSMEEKILHEHRTLFFEEYCCIIKVQLENAVKQVDALANEFDLATIISQLQPIVHNIECVLANYDANYFKTHITLKELNTLKTQLCELASLFEQTLCNLTMKIMSHTSDDQATLLKLYEINKNVVSMAHNINKLFSARNLTPFDQELLNALRSLESTDGQHRASTQPAAAQSAGTAAANAKTE